MMWSGIAVGAVAYYLLGAAWFTPLFGRAWDRSIGHDRSGPNTRFSISYYIVPFVSALTATTVIAALANALSTTGVVPSALVGMGFGLGIAAASVTNALTPHTPHPYLFAIITGGYHLFGCTIAGIIVGLLR